MNYHKKILKNGLRVVTIPMPSSESVTVTVWANVGSRYEPEKIAGISHFLEHIVFKGSKKRPTAKDISFAIDGLGAEMNAATSKEWTNFYIQSAKIHLDKAFDVLSDMLLNPLIKEDEVEREKGVILEEKSMYEDMPIRDIWDVFEETVFAGNSLAVNTVGTEESIKNITRNDFLRYRSKYYYPENMLITVAGGVTEKEVLELANKYFSDLTKSIKPTPYKKLTYKTIHPLIKLKSKKIEQAHLILGFKGFKAGNPDRFAESLLATILGSGMSSRLFLEVRERRGLAYTVRTTVEHYQDCGYIATYAGVDPIKAEETIKVILDEEYKLRDGVKKITDEELTKAKEFTKGHLALMLEDSSSVNQFFGEQELLLNKILTPEEIFKEIDKVRVEDIIHVAKKIFVKNNLTLTVIGPYNTSNKFTNLLK